MSAFDWLAAREAERVAAGLRRHLAPRAAGEDGLIDLASNDYLGLSKDPASIELPRARRPGRGVAVRPARGWSPGPRCCTRSSRARWPTSSGRLPVSSSRPATSPTSAAVTALAGPGTLVISDAHNHASIIDACRLSRARVVVVPHLDVDAVAVALADRIEPRRTGRHRCGLQRRRRGGALGRPACGLPHATVPPSSSTRPTASASCGDGGVGLAASLGLAGDPTSS